MLGVKAEQVNAKLGHAAGGSQPLLISVGSEEARMRAGLRPPLKLHVRFSRMQLSRRLTDTGMPEKVLNQASAQARTRHKAWP